MRGHATPCSCDAGLVPRPECAQIKARHAPQHALDQWRQDLDTALVGSAKDR